MTSINLYGWWEDDEMVISEEPRGEGLIQMISGASCEDLDPQEFDGIEDEIRRNLRQQLQANKNRFDDR